MKTSGQSLAKYIMPLNMNGLEGRMLRLPARSRSKKREILLIYGHHSTLERCSNLANELSKYGAVTVPDLPGFGGMESFYKLGERPTLNRLADYVATFIKLTYKRRRLTIVGIGYGLVIVTRMLQRYPKVAQNVDMVVSLGGFAHRDDFSFDNRWRKNYRRQTQALSWQLPALIFQRTKLPASVAARLYVGDKPRVKNNKLAGNTVIPSSLDFEINWHDTDLRTHMITTSTMLTLDNCKHQVAVPIWHVPLSNQNYLDRHIVEQHLQVIFDDFHVAEPAEPAKKGRKRTVQIPDTLPPALRRALNARAKR